MLNVNAVSGKRRLVLTPLIDIVFILLIFFVLQTNFIKLGKLDFSSAGEAPPAEAAPVERGLQIDVFGRDRIWFGGEQFTLARLRKVLAAADYPGDTPVVVACADDISVQLLVDVMDVLREQSLLRIEVTGVDY